MDDRFGPETRSSSIHHFVRPDTINGVGAVVQGTMSSTANPLTAREKQILCLIAEDRSNNEIAAALRITPKTVEFHRHAIKTKIGVKGTAGLVRYAIRAGLIEP